MLDPAVMTDGRYALTTNVGMPSITHTLESLMQEVIDPASMTFLWCYYKLSSVEIDMQAMISFNYGTAPVPAISVTTSGGWTTSGPLADQYDCFGAFYDTVHCRCKIPII